MNLSPELEKIVSVRIIQEDTETIYSLLKSERDPVFSMGAIPYFALYVQSFQEYVGKECIPDNEVTRIKNIRNHIKDYSEGFGKSKRIVSQTDQKHDEEYREQLRFAFMKNWNVHLNLGTYWTNDGVIVGNTQQLASFLDVDNVFDSACARKSYELGVLIGSFVNSVKEGLKTSLDPLEVCRPNTEISIRKYCDFNTNKINLMFVDNSQRELNLFYLHLLCNMNFVKHILRNMLDDNNSWLFRIEYIVAYYTYRALKRLKNYCDNNHDIVMDTEDIKYLIEDGMNLFQTKFRNCMMHYNLVNQEVLSSKYIDKPFYGMIETCFNGMSFDAYRKLLWNMSDRVIECLEKRFDFSKVELKDL